MSATWTSPTDPTAGDPATANFMRVNVTQNLRHLKGEVDAINTAKVLKVGYKSIDAQSTYGPPEVIVAATYTTEGSSNPLLVEANYSVKQVAESNFLDLETRDFRSTIEYSTDGGTNWNKPVEYLSRHVTDPASSLREWSELVNMRALIPSLSGTVDFRVRHTAFDSAGGWVAQDGAGLFTIMELEATAL